MLSKSLFLRLTVSIFEDSHYEALQTIGDPMVLHDGTDGHPIASIHLKSGGGGGSPCLITKQNEHLFQALWNPEHSKEEIFVVLTNLEFFECILFGVATDEVASHIKLRPGESYKLVLIPDARTFTFAVCPTKADRKYVDAKWVCPEIICRQRILSEENHASDHELEELDQECVSQLAKLKLVQANYAVEPVYGAREERTRALMLRQGMDIIYETVINRAERLLECIRNNIYATSECVICMEDDSPPDVILVKCGHRMVHDQCLLRTAKNKECPTCRAPIVAKIHV